VQQNQHNVTNIVADTIWHLFSKSLYMDMIGHSFACQI
jgi:hypothetical protein